MGEQGVGGCAQACSPACGKAWLHAVCAYTLLAKLRRAASYMTHYLYQGYPQGTFHYVVTLAIFSSFLLCFVPWCVVLIPLGVCCCRSCGLLITALQHVCGDKSCTYCSATDAGSLLFGAWDWPPRRTRHVRHTTVAGHSFTVAILLLMHYGWGVRTFVMGGGQE